MSHLVYIHYRSDNGAVFYVGKGTPRRCGTRVGRNKQWKSVVQSAGGFKTVVFADQLTEERAFEVEKQLIEDMRSIGAPLTNIVSGGGGVRGYKHTEEMKAHLRSKSFGNKSRTGQRLSAEERKKIGESQRGNKKSIETRRRQGLAVKCVTNGKTYGTISEAAKELGLWTGAITSVCRGKMKQTGGYQFVYADGISPRPYTRKTT